MRIFVAATLLLLSPLAHADQCAFLDTDAQQYVYKSAQKLLKSQEDYVEFCEPCGDGPSAVKSAQHVRIDPGSVGNTQFPEYRQITVDGVGKDLAYLYVRTGSRVFTNMALLVGCPAQGVSPVLHTAPGHGPKAVSWEELSSAGRTPSSAKKNKK